MTATIYVYNILEEVSEGITQALTYITAEDEENLGCLVDAQDMILEVLESLEDEL